MDKRRAWLEQCESAYQVLLLTCDENSILDDEYSDFRNNLKNFVSKIFWIFQDINFIRAEFLFHDNGEPLGIYDKRLCLCVYFPHKRFATVEKWFDDSDFTDYIIYDSNEMGESILKIPVTSIIYKLTQDEIRSLREDCEEKAKPFLEGKENEILSEYEEKCLEEDEYYLGVRFISYDGKFPNYCKGTVRLEIEGVEYCFILSNLLSGDSYYIKGIKPEAFPINIRRYYHEIIRVMVKNLNYGCCGGCN